MRYTYKTMAADRYELWETLRRWALIVAQCSRLARLLQLCSTLFGFIRQAGSDRARWPYVCLDIDAWRLS